MYIYLSKKIAIPNNTKINCLSWNREDGYIAVGGEDGLLKVLKLESGADSDGTVKSRGLAASSNLSMNQTLEGHTKTIRVITWNEGHQKLTTSDENGVIIVWMLYKGAWYEEMLNNRKKSTVAGMAWSTDGTKICIIYEDGAVIVGSVDGNRIWGKELKNTPLAKVQWSPDGKLLLFGLKSGEVHLYDNQGNYIMQIDIVCMKMVPECVPMFIVGLDWYNGRHGYVHALCPSLAICYDNGLIQLMCNESDSDPTVLETKMAASHCCWNHNGSLLAVAGRQQEEDKESNVVQFYSPFGDHLRTLKVPGMSLTCCAWEEGSLRVALAVDSFVYFANIRPDYKWCYFKKTVVYTSCRLQKAGVCITFWDITNNQCHTRFVPVLLALGAAGDYCVLGSRLDTENPLAQYGLLLCNTLGVAVDGRQTNLEPKWLAMNTTHVFGASKDNFYIWHYRTPKSPTINIKNSNLSVYHIDHNPTGALEVIRDITLGSDQTEYPTYPSSDPICCIAVSEKMLIIGRESGIIQQYTIPHVALIHKIKMNLRPHKFSINCNSSRLGVIDMAGVLTVLDITESRHHMEESAEKMLLQRKDVWAMCWAHDNSQLLAIMEKTRMYVFKGIYPEEPISSAGYICSFQDLEIQAVALDEVMESPDKPVKDFLFKLEVKSLRDTRQLLEKVGIKEAAQFIEDNPHPRLWQLLGEAALKELNFEVSESAFIRSQDYSGIQYVKKLQALNNVGVKKASLEAYFKHFDEAEKLFIEADRRDLAMSFRRTLGDWFRVIHLIKYSGFTVDKTLNNAYNHTGDYFAQMNNWSAALEYYTLAKNKAQILECYYRLDDYDSLEGMVDYLDDHDPLLARLANIFTIEGMYKAAVKTYLKMKDMDGAIRVSILHNQWDNAIKVSTTEGLSDVSQAISRYADHLIQQGKLAKAVEINLQAKYWLSAARYVVRMAKKESKRPNKNLHRMKMLYVYAARLIVNYKKAPNKDDQIHSLEEAALIEYPWRAAEAVHYFILAHQHIYENRIFEALCTLYNLILSVKFIPAEEIYSILALVAIQERAYSLASMMFVKLNSMGEIVGEEKEAYRSMAVKLFMKISPEDVKSKKSFGNCYNCKKSVFNWQTSCNHCDVEYTTCVASGIPINTHATDTSGKDWYCPTCYHVVLSSRLHLQKCCPLCHTRILTYNF